MKCDFRSDSNQDNITKQTGREKYKKYTAGVIFYCHLKMGPSRCRETGSWLSLLQRYGEAD